MDTQNTNNQRDFHHPYTPYSIQLQFMNAVYDCLEAGKIGIFESPTGTGKSLSLICGALTWLRDHKRRTFEEGFGEELKNSDEPAWLIESALRQKKEEAVRRRRDMELRLAKIRAREKRVKERWRNGDEGMRFKRQKTGVDQTDEDRDEARFVLDDYESDGDGDLNGKKKKEIFDESGISAETQALMQELGFAFDKKKEEEQDIDELKIFFCSRTHSQLSQFTSELRRVRMPPAISISSSDSQPHNPNPTSSSRGDEEVGDMVEHIKHLTLGSRKNLCINPKVKKLGNATAINERCLELQQPGTAAEKKCPFMPTRETEAIVHDFRDHALAQIRDIEDLGSLGQKLGICPYYASRPATKYCEIVTLPYPLLLQKSTREALGLSLKNHIIIIDEAHNLMDAIAGIYSVSVTLAQLELARAQITVYLQKFRNKLKGRNRVYVAQIVRLLDSVISYLRAKKTGKEKEGVVEIAGLMAGKGVDQTNLFKLNRYLQESRLARKVDGYTVFAEQQQQEREKEKQKQNQSGNNIKTNTTVSKPTARQTVPVLTHIQSFLLSLMNPSKEGRFFYAKDEGEGIELKYMLLDPTFHFKDIVEEARAVVLAGGTMSPMSDYAQHLLSYVKPERIMTLSCEHVIPPEQLLAVPVVRGESGAEFDFTFENRNSDRTMLDLANAILTFIQHISDGVVIFFPSYAYLDFCVSAWKRLKHPSSSPSPTPQTFWTQISALKPIFLEQRSVQHQQQQQQQSPSETPQPSSTDSVLSAYSTAIATGKGKGALLLAVIGGSLSEGINFSDTLGRGVIVIGLPFPNPHSAEWKAKTQYISTKTTLAYQSTAGSDGKDAKEKGRLAAREYYENCCMRAVNQCVGRAIRHRGDYAAILMVDKRYGGERIRGKLPGWIRGSLKNGTAVREVGGLLGGFFEGKS